MKEIHKNCIYYRSSKDAQEGYCALHPRKVQPSEEACWYFKPSKKAKQDSKENKKAQR